MDPFVAHGASDDDDNGSTHQESASRSPAVPLISLAGTFNKNPSEIDTTLIETSSRPLPPRVLRGYTSAHFIKEAYATFGLIAFIAIASWACRWLATGQFTAVLNDCQSTTATNSERLFLPNVRVFWNLSFARAKVIDLAWDIIIGQVGRLLHCWVLYRLVASSLTWILEYSSVPYHVPLNWLFSTVSLQSIWSSWRLIIMGSPIHTILMASWLIYATLYAFSFSAIWSVAAAYLSPSITLLSIPGMGYVSDELSSGLNLCWSVDSSRYGASMDIVTGPPLTDLYTSIEAIGGEADWGVALSSDSSASDEFWNLFACKSLTGVLVFPGPTLTTMPTCRRQIQEDTPSFPYKQFKRCQRISEATPSDFRKLCGRESFRLRCNSERHW